MAEDHRIFSNRTYVSPSIKTCEYWFRRFKSDDFIINDKDRSRQSKKLINTDLQALLNENTIHSELARELIV